MSAGFTPGPWKFVPWHIAESASEVRAPDGWLVCCTSSDANARLIASAPDLLAELVGARDMLAAFGQATAVEGINVVLAQARGDLVDPLEQVKS